MAIEARRTRDPLRRPTPGLELPDRSVPVPELHSRRGWANRLGDVAPLIGSLTIASSIFWAPWHRHTATLLAASLLVFFVYWLLRSYAVAIACAVGLRRIREWKRVDWQARYAGWATGRSRAHAWDWPRHLVIIPNYRESEAELTRTLESLAAQPNAQQLMIALAMEEREDDAERKAARLLLAFRGRFGDLFATYHPRDVPGEAPGKGSNEAWAARQAYVRLIAGRADDLRRYTVTSCDADAVFHQQHFAALNYLFLTARDRHRTFWQPAIFNSNNIWDVPLPLRIPDGLSGINRLANLVIPASVKFPTSCYSLSWSMLHAVDYWDEEVIAEDWHLYLKCAFTLGDRVHVEALYLPLGNDCVLADSTMATLRAHYNQAVRHAWGATDIPYAWRATWQRRRASFWRGVTLASALTKVHLMWFAQWYLITLGVFLPAKMAGTLDAPMPYWWTHRAFHIPGPGWHPENALQPVAWLTFDRTGVVEPTMWLNICGLLIALCIFPLLVLIALELRMRGPRPAGVGRWQYVTQLGMWPLMAPITFVWASLPALHAQWRMATHRGLVYRVAAKGSRRAADAAPQPAAIAAVAEAMRELAAHTPLHRRHERTSLAASGSIAGNMLIL